MLGDRNHTPSFVWYTQDVAFVSNVWYKENFFVVLSVAFFVRLDKVWMAGGVLDILKKCLYVSLESLLSDWRNSEEFTFFIVPN